MKKPKKKGLHPAVAVVGLVVSLGVVGKALLGGGVGRAPGISGTAASSGSALPDQPNSGANKGADAIRWRDLLEQHGSFERGKPVRLAFSLLVDAASVGAVPAMETKGDGPRLWNGGDPPVLQLGVVMISAAARRAVLAGKVVGVGDAVDKGRVLAIERGTLTLSWSGRELTYDLDSEYPREFRAEQQRRASGNKETSATTAPGADTRSDKKQEAK